MKRPIINPVLAEGNTTIRCFRECVLLAHSYRPALNNTRHLWEVYKNAEGKFIVSFQVETNTIKEGDTGSRRNYVRVLDKLPSVNDVFFAKEEHGGYRIPLIVLDEAWDAEAAHYGV